ncbi:MAG: ATP-binding protein [Rhodococcus sp. (in: high G+C Gram-positive bacteria)]
MTQSSVTKELTAVDTRVLPPDPDVMAAIGLSHTMNSAIADLIDNSLDATANRINIRFVVRNGKPYALIITDNGHGMSDTAIDAAMTVGRRHHYEGTALGHFGMGLKAASFSQAEVLTVIARDQYDKSNAVVGRRWSRQGVQTFECEVLEPTQCSEQLDAVLPSVESDSGTMVKWDGVRTFPASSDQSVIDEYLTRTIDDLRFHLGLVLHRILETRSLKISIDVLDADSNELGAPRRVESVNPFGYRRPGRPAYPVDFNAQVEGVQISLRAHIWPARSQALEFRLDGNTSQRQGFYFYRNDRLLEGGGWKNVFTMSRRTQLARVEVDIDHREAVYDMNMEKSSVHPRPGFGWAVENAVSATGVSFKDYLESSETVFTDGNVRSRKREALVPPGQGFAPSIKRAVSEEFEEHELRSPVQVRWRKINTGEFFEIDRGTQTLWLNEKYRKMLSNGKRAGVNDAPLLKASLYLLMEQVFRGAAFGSKAKDNVSAWQSILTDAAEDEYARK